MNKTKSSQQTTTSVEVDENTSTNDRNHKATPSDVSLRANEPISEDHQKIIDKLLDGETTPVRKQGLEQLQNLPDEEKKQICRILGRLLNDEESSLRRSWTITGLAATKEPGVVDLVTKHLNSKVEPAYMVRYWAVLSLSDFEVPDLQKRLTPALQKDEHPRVRATAFRLLIDNGYEEYVDKLLTMTEGQDSKTVSEACRAFRLLRGLKPLRKEVEGKVIPVLTQRLQDQDVISDARYQAARALGGMKHKWVDAIRALGYSLEDERAAWIRDGCILALMQINRPEVRDLLVLALSDSGPSVRVRAAEALKKVLGPPTAVNAIIDQLLQQEQPPPEYIDALRLIDHSIASKVLSDNLLHPDPTIGDKASRALTLLGGEEAMRTLQVQRTKALDIYTDMLGEADKHIMAQFNSLIERAQLGFQMSMWMHGIIFGIGVLILLVSVYVALLSGFERLVRFIGTGTAAGSLGTLLYLFYKNPLNNIRYSVTGLVKVNVVFLGYIRQINQIDATFKQIFLSSTDFGTEQMKETVEQIQTAVKQTMEEVEIHLSAE